MRVVTEGRGKGVEGALSSQAALVDESWRSRAFGRELRQLHPANSRRRPPFRASYSGNVPPRISHFCTFCHAFSHVRHFSQTPNRELWKGHTIPAPPSNLFPTPSCAEKHPPRSSSDLEVELWLIRTSLASAKFPGGSALALHSFSNLNQTRRAALVICHRVVQEQE